MKSLNGETQMGQGDLPLFLWKMRLLLPNGEGKGHFPPKRSPCGGPSHAPDSRAWRLAPKPDVPAMMEMSMNRTVLALALTFGLAGVAAQAQTVVSDTDGNGTYSVEELTAAYADMSGDLFAQIDVDGSGQVDADELQAARENGLIAP